MTARASDRKMKPRRPSARCNWLEKLDRRARELPAGSNWLEDSELALQRCRRLIMARFPELPRPLSDRVFCSELSRGEKQIENSEHGNRILSGLNAMQRSQLAGLFLDVFEALETHTRHRHSSKTMHELAAEAERRTRMLFRKAVNIRRKLEGLQKYAEHLHPSLGLEYIRVAKSCLKTLENLKEDPSAGDFYAWLKAEYPMLEDPRQLGMVELYWFFRYECRCSGRESEVRVAMIANEFWALPGSGKLKYIPKYRDAESQGCSAVRLAVSRYRPGTTD